MGPSFLSIFGWGWQLQKAANICTTPSDKVICQVCFINYTRHYYTGRVMIHSVGLFHFFWSLVIPSRALPCGSAGKESASLIWLKVNILKYVSIRWGINWSGGERRCIVMGEERRRTETSRAGPYSRTIQGKVPHQVARFSCIFLGLFLLRKWIYQVTRAWYY